MLPGSLTQVALADNRKRVILFKGITLFISLDRYMHSGQVRWVARLIKGKIWSVYLWDVTFTSGIKADLFIINGVDSTDWQAHLPLSSKESGRSADALAE
jgi:hypothetical protein